MALPSCKNAASRAASKRIPAQPGTSEHMAQFLVDFINECGRTNQTRSSEESSLSAVPREVLWTIHLPEQGLLQAV